MNSDLSAMYCRRLEKSASWVKICNSFSTGGGGGFLDPWQGKYDINKGTHGVSLLLESTYMFHVLFYLYIYRVLSNVFIAWYDYIVKIVALGIEVLIFSDK